MSVLSAVTEARKRILGERHPHTLWLMSLYGNLLEREGLIWQSF